jgi:hypothetical protein
MTAVMRFMASRRRTSLLNILCHVTICVCVCVCVGGVGQDTCVNQGLARGCLRAR